jgi:hypothetical protein
MVALLFDDLSALWAIISGIAVSGLGLYILKGGKARPRGALPFGLFGIVWGVQIASINAARIVELPSTSESFYLAALVGLFFQPYFLVEFAASQTERGGRTVRWRLIRGLAATLAISSAAILILRPSWLFGGVQAANATFYPQWGPAFVPLTSLPVFLALALAMGVLSARSRNPETRRTDWINRYLFAGLGIYASYAAGYYLLLNADLALALGLTSDVLPYLGYVSTFALLGGIVLFSGYRNLDRWRRSGRRSDHHKFLALALSAPFLLGLLNQAAVISGLSGLNVIGIVRLLGVAVIAYGFARRREYDLPQRTRRAGATATGSASALAVGGTGFGVVSILSSGLAWPLLAGLAFAGATAMPALRWARQLFGVHDGNPVDEAEQLYEQKIETYRAALEDAMAQGTLEEDEAFLEGLRERFGVSEEEDRILRYYARKATVPCREGDPETAYEKLRILGEGGAGRTWLARDRSRDRLAVLKEPLEQWHTEPAVLDAARREADLAAKVRHPNVIEVEAVLEDEGRPVLVMEYVAGGSLAEHLRRHGTMEAREAVKLGFDLAAGLQAIHDTGIVHRDLTPDNVLLTDEGRALIADFGLARDQDGSGTRLLDEEAGTKGYQAPEAARGSDDPAVDVYGLAAILHTCLYGSPPVEGTVQVEADVPGDLQAVVQQGLRRDPEERFDDAEAFAEALGKVIDE